MSVHSSVCLCDILSLHLSVCMLSAVPSTLFFSVWCASIWLRYLLLSNAQNSGYFDFTWTTCCKNGLSPASIFIYFCLSKQTLQFLQQIYVKNVHLVYGVGILTHNLQNMSLLPWQLDQGSCPIWTTCCQKYSSACYFYIWQSLSLSVMSLPKFNARICLPNDISLTDIRVW